MVAPGRAQQGEPAARAGTAERRAAQRRRNSPVGRVCPPRRNVAARPAAGSRRSVRDTAARSASGQATRGTRGPSARSPRATSPRSGRTSGRCPTGCPAAGPRPRYRPPSASRVVAAAHRRAPARPVARHRLGLGRSWPGRRLRRRPPSRRPGGPDRPASPARGLGAVPRRAGHRRRDRALPIVCGATHRIPITSHAALIASIRPLRLGARSRCPGGIAREAAVGRGDDLVLRLRVDLQDLVWVRLAQPAEPSPGPTVAARDDRGCISSPSPATECGERL